MNSIDTLIALANVRGSLDLRCQFQGGWTLEHPQEALGMAPYHIVLAGQCRVELPDGQCLHLRAGDVLLLPEGSPHVMRSPGRRVPAIAPVVEASGAVPVHRLGDREVELDMLCGRFFYNRASMLFAALPQYLLIPGVAAPGEGPLAALVALLRGEADGAQAGARSLLDALSSALFTLMLRAYLDSALPQSGTLALLGDKRLGRAWQAMLTDPAHQWNIDGLAQAAAMSRATFMRAFVRVAGVSPWALLTRVRMERAFGLLRHSHLSLSDIAAEVGYQSQAAFSKKFKEAYGEAPGKLRRQI